MKNPLSEPPLRLKDRMEALCAEMVEKGILFSEAMHQFEQCFIKEVMRRNKDNVTQTADCLGIHRNTLAKKISRKTIPK